MSIVTFDTCIFITHGPLSKLPKGFRLSAVVLQELTAGADDASELQFWENTGKALEKEGKLLVPSAEDWWLAGKILNSLQRRNKSPKTGKIPKLTAEETHRIIRDVLIARSAKAANALLVTNNLDDFMKIKSYCDIRVIGGTDYFA